MFTSTRSKLAATWTFLNLVVLAAFVAAVVVIVAIEEFARDPYNQYVYRYQYRNNNYYGNNQGGEEEELLISVTSRAIIFAAGWTFMIAMILGIYGSVVLGVNICGKYYWCCPRSVLELTPTVVGSFMGALFMFANLTFICAALFKEISVKDYYMAEGEGGREGQEMITKANERSAFVFCILCFFLTAVYALFTYLLFKSSDDILRENQEDTSEEVRSFNHMFSKLSTIFTFNSICAIILL